MCGIFGSSDKDTFLDLARINSYRGNYSFTLTNSHDTHRRLGAVDTELIHSMWIAGEYHMGHIQAPTGAYGGLKKTHPSVKNNTKMWHNGIITAPCINRLSKVAEEKEWDTSLLHRLFLEDISNLRLIDGTFSCVFENVAGEIMLFRNAASPMFVSGTDISTTPWKTATPTKPNTVYTKTDAGFREVAEFKNSSCPYYFG